MYPLGAQRTRFFNQNLTFAKSLQVEVLVPYNDSQYIGIMGYRARKKLIFSTF